MHKAGNRALSRAVFTALHTQRISLQQIAESYLLAHVSLSELTRRLSEGEYNLHNSLPTSSSFKVKSEGQMLLESNHLDVHTVTSCISDY